MSDLRGLAEALTPGRRDGLPTEGPYHLDQVASVDLTTSPPTLILDTASGLRPIPFLGPPSAWHPGDVAVWLDGGTGDAVALGSRNGLGCGDPLDPEDSELEAWREVGDTDQPIFQSSWVNYDAVHTTAAFYKAPDQWVRLKGLIKSGTSAGTMFTLPAGYRPPFDCYFTVSSNDAAGSLRVLSTGEVSKPLGGGNTFCSLDGVTFPTAWNREAWPTPAIDNGASMLTSVDYPESTIEVFIRHDGWVWLKGALVNGTFDQPMLWLPEPARPRRYPQLVGVVSGLGVSRVEIDGRGYITRQSTATSNSTTNHAPVGGLNWFGGWSNAGSWADITPASGWVAFGSGWQAPQYRRDAQGVVHLRGLLNGTSRTGETIVNLPAGFRPAQRCTFHAISNNGHGRFYVDPTGDVVRVNGTTNYVSLNNATWRAEA